MQRQLNEYAERLKKMEDEREALRVDMFNVQQGGYRMNQQRGYQVNQHGGHHGTYGNFQGNRQGGGNQGRQGHSGNYRQYNQNQQQPQAGYGYQGQRNDYPAVMCFNCGKDGHIARFGSEYHSYQGYNNNQNSQNPEENQAGHMARNSAPAQGAGGHRTVLGLRITEVPDVAAIQVLSSAAGGVRVVRELVKYVDPVDVYAGERQRHSEMTSGGDSIVVRARRRAAVAVAFPELQTTTMPREPLAQPAPEELAPQFLEDSESEIEMKTRPAPKSKDRVQTKKAPRKPKPPRRIRMMMGHPEFNVLAEFREMLVSGLKWGALLDIALAVRRTVSTELLLELAARTPNGKAPAAAAGEAVDAAVVNAKFKKDLEEKPCLNFFTKAVIQASSRLFEVEKALIDEVLRGPKKHDLRNQGSGSPSHLEN